MKATVFGKEYDVFFNMAVQLEFEDLSGQPFELPNNAAGTSGTLGTQKALLQLCYACLAASNAKLPFTFDQMTGREEYDGNRGISVEENAALLTTVTAAMREWYHMPAVMDKDEQAADDEEDDPKNA